MIYEKILVQKNFQIAEFLYKTYGAWVILEQGEMKEQASKQVEQDLNNMFYQNNPNLVSRLTTENVVAEMPITQVSKEKPPYIATEEDIIKEMGTYRLGKQAFIAVYGKQVLGNPKLEQAFNDKLKELSNG